MKKLILLIFLSAVLCRTESVACTIIMVSDSKVTLAGSNEDSPFPLTMIWFVPASEGSYGRVCMGYKMMFNSIQGGMNEKGLFIDGNALGKQGWKADENKALASGDLMDRLLSTCASIEDVKEYFNTYNTPALDQARIPVMDRSGASMIVEWYNGQVVFLETNEPYQIATNFVGSQFIGAEKPCWRYNKADEMLRDKETFSMEYLRDALDSTHQEGRYNSTVYSFICNLQNGEITVYNYHDFSNSITFGLREELEKGYHEQFLGNLFDDPNEEYVNFVEEGPVNMVEFGYSRVNIMSANLFFGVLKQHYPKAFNKTIGIDVLSQVGQDLVEQGDAQGATMFLERNAKEFPDSARAHFELANAYLQVDNKEKAIAGYKKTLALDPDHPRARQALEQLSQ